jgi:aryl-alcohol dehydrogenase-like predicted oxidoreductase
MTKPVGKRRVSSDGLTVSELGLGCMGMSQSYGPADEAESILTIRQALDAGVILIDTADVYGNGHNERLVGRAIEGRRPEVVLATKFSLSRDASGERKVNGRPENVRACCDASLARLGVDYIDLYYQHRVDPTVPIEDTIGAMAELVEAGKVRHLGLSEASSRSIERAAAVHPISALQSEWSLWTRELEDEVLETTRRLGIGIVAYGPLGRGFLTGAIKSPADFEAGDSRITNPRFQGENFTHNLTLVEAVRDVARAKGCTTGQLALAWVLAQGPDVVAIPGTKHPKYLAENVGAVGVELTDADLSELNSIVPRGIVRGVRSAAAQDYGDSPSPALT